MELLDPEYHSHLVPAGQFATAKPQQNAYVERYNPTVRHEWMGLDIFDSIEEVQQITTEWRWSYNNERSNMDNGGITPAQKLKMVA